MFSVYADDTLIYSTNVPTNSNSGLFIENPVLKLKLNTSGSFKFTIYPTHPAYSAIIKLKTLISVYEDDALIWKGRVLNDTTGWQNQRTIECEGVLSYLVDSIQRPFAFPEDAEHGSPADYLAFLVARHNEQMPKDKRFLVGNVTVTDINDYIRRSDTEYSNTWELIEDGLLDKLGGYLVVRYERDGLALDYLADFDTLGNQPVKFGANLLTIETEQSGEDFATAILPLGAKDEESGERVTIADLADDASGDIVKSGDIIYSAQFEAQYGRILKRVIFNDVTVASNLLRKARAKLNDYLGIACTTTITAADLSAAGYDYNAFHVGTYVEVVDAEHEAHGLERFYLVKELKVPLDKPYNLTLSIGAKRMTYTDNQLKTERGNLQRIEADISTSKTTAIREMQERTSSMIETSESAIRSYVSDEFYTRDEAEDLVASMTSRFEQLADSMQMTFSQLQTNINEVAADTDAKFSQYETYIRFSADGIEIGKNNDTVKIRIGNDRVAFIDGGVEVAYFSNNKLYVTDAEIVDSLKIGNFAFIPRSNGNLSFKKVTN